MSVSDRTKVLLFFALVGFIAGMVADLTYRLLAPQLNFILSLIIENSIVREALLAGFAGAVFTVAIVSIWAFKGTEF